MVKLDGSAKAKEIRKGIKDEVDQLSRKYGEVPGLAVIIVGQDSASQIYVRTKEKIARRLKFRSEVKRFEPEIAETELLDSINIFNRDPRIDGILIQTPLPEKFNTWKILDSVDTRKDVDGFHPCNLGLNMLNRTDVFPCTPSGIVRLLDLYGISVEGLNVVILGRSFIVGKPLAVMLTNRHATVTVCHTRTRDLAAILKRADMIVAAAGHPGIVTGEMVREGAILVDVGINYLTSEAEVTKYCTPRQIEKFREKGYGITGDIAPAAFSQSSYYTPVPGGIGKMTVAMLMENTLTLFKKHRLKL
jgi:methylenetetrahydrofolate dehydrogenase (NADP+)/methenyltetrahydrofolate cyclohydrolase